MNTEHGRSAPAEERASDAGERRDVRQAVRRVAAEEAVRWRELLERLK
ncbi:hypothetical protein [Streptomyces alkaliterrae]|uniref:Uncharacterized protein n=1 Tax=Streptomyces alkaliterrae TaxID=2213162 RepID=A0A7W3WZJ2_9ACTN|nr:hypothetical protein [Streptomyces alkaliterrae]MBB1256765.1 hypothetical protein [Streptomyces alkaliterrae]MBB1261408.1 hypothetical protein [Streptomyces alkaliterrae]